MNEGEIPLSEEHKRILIESIYNGTKQDIIEFRNTYELETQNSLGFLKWDFINTNLVRTIPDKGFQCIKSQRGSWRFVLIYDTETGFLYSLMHEQRFFDVVEQRQYRAQVHYVDALASLNKGFKGDMKGSVGQQSNLGLYDTDDGWINEIESVLDKIIPGLVEEVKQYVVVCFSAEKGEIASVSAYIPSPNLTIVHVEDWSELIPADYHLAAYGIDIDVHVGNDDIEIKLRDDVVQAQQDDKIAQFRDYKDEEQDDIVHLRDDGDEKQV